MEYLQSITIVDGIYLVCFLVGMILIVLDLLLGSISGVLNLDIDFDGLSFTEFLPLRPMSILALITVFGAVGVSLSIAWSMVAKPIIFVVAVVLGYAVSLIIEKLILRPLKNNDASAMKANELVGQTAEVTVRIRPGGAGEVSVKNARGIFNYRACLFEEEGEMIDTGEVVGIFKVSDDKGTVFVVALDQAKLRSAITSGA